MLRWLFATVHLLALGIGLGAIWVRARTLAGTLDAAGLKRLFAADNWWAAAAGLWLATGLTRLFTTLEKGSAYYFHNTYFIAKMAMFLLIFALELAPMIAFIRWRGIVRKGGTPDTSRAAVFARTSAVQAILVVLIVLAATAMARGFGMR